MPKVFDYFLSAGLTRDAASQLAAAVKQNAGAFLIVNPDDATAMSVEIRVRRQGGFEALSEACGARQRP